MREHGRRACGALLVQRAAGKELHRDGGMGGVLREIMDAHNLRMAEKAGAVGLFLEQRERGGIPAHLIREKFQRHVAAERFVACPPHHAHAAAAEHVLQRIAPESALPGRGAAHRGLGVGAGETHGGGGWSGGGGPVNCAAQGATRKIALAFWLRGEKPSKGGQASRLSAARWRGTHTNRP